MSKELVISAASHERRVAILEEGQLVEIYIEREKEFVLVGSIYKGRVTRVLPGMQSAFVDIGLDGDAFLYVSDVFENLEDYDHDHGHGHGPQVSAIPPAAALVEALPGESLANAHSSDEAAPLSADDAAQQAIPHEEPMHADFTHEHEHDGSEAMEAHGEGEAGENRAAHSEPEERQPESNASAPQNFGQYNPTQKYSRPGGNDRNDRGGQDFRGDRGGDRGRGGRFGRRGGRRRGGRPQGGRNLPPSKYASPQSSQEDQRPHDSRGGYESHGQQQGRGFEPREHRRQEGSRFSPPAAPPRSGEDDIVLPGESLAKYRNKPTAAAPAPALVEPEIHEPQPDLGESIPSRSNVQPGGTPSGGNLPRRSSGGLPRWLLAETGNEAEASTESSPSSDDTVTTESQALSNVSETIEQEPARSDAPLSEEDVAVISSSLIEAKHEETQAYAAADTLVGGATFEETEEEEDQEEEETHAEEQAEEHEEIHASEAEAEAQDVSAEEIEGIETRALDSHALREAEADAAHESALHAAAIGEPETHGETGREPIEATGAEFAPAPPNTEDDSILLPGETRAPRSGAPEPRPDFPRDSARIGGNPRARFQRPYRSGGRDRDNRGRDNRGGDNRGGDNRGGGRPDNRRGGRPGGGPRFERRGPGGPHRHHGRDSGPARRPQLISEMLKAGQDIVIQIAKEPLGKKGARITSHVALPGRFLVYMPTIDHIGVSRKIAAAENRSRLRRLVGEARGAYPGGFIVRTAAGGASDEEIRTDIEFLGKTWNEIKERSEQRKSPALLHRDLNLVERILRDYVSDDFSAIWIDSEEEYGKVVEFVSRFQPKLVNRVKLYSKETPIFEEFGIQHELDKALRAKVWLKSGGYIVINHTEALVAIDVNTGKFVGKGSTRLEDTIVKTNLEAVKEIVRQIRLRDLGGIIVVDFIDMEERRNREKVLVALQQALEQDKAPSKALSFNEFGLVCITRKRTKQALERVLCQPCPYCTGSGMVKSIPTLCYEIQAEARKMATATADNETPNLTLRVHPEIAKALKTRESMLIDELEQTTHKHVIIQSDATLHWEQYDIC
jgi:ribonuclease G